MIPNPDQLSRQRCAELRSNRSGTAFYTLTPAYSPQAQAPRLESYRRATDT